MSLETQIGPQGAGEIHSTKIHSTVFRFPFSETFFGYSFFKKWFFEYDFSHAIKVAVFEAGARYDS